MTSSANTKLRQAWRDVQGDLSDRPQAAQNEEMLGRDGQGNGAAEEVPHDGPYPRQFQ